jgi:hypothetical protein
MRIHFHFFFFFISNTKQLTNFFLLQGEPWDWLNILHHRSSNNNSMSCCPRRWCCSSPARCARWSSPPRTCWRRTPRPTASATSAPSALSLFPRHPPLHTDAHFVRVAVSYSFDTNLDPDPAFWAEYRSGSNPDPGF